MGVRLTGSRSYTSTGEQELFSVPGDYVAFLRGLNVYNGSSSDLVLKLYYYNGDDRKLVREVKVLAGGSELLGEELLPKEACPTKMTVDINAQPVDVAFDVELE